MELKMRSRRSLTCAAVVFGLLACSDQSIPRSVFGPRARIRRASQCLDFSSAGRRHCERHSRGTR